MSDVILKRETEVFLCLESSVGVLNWAGLTGSSAVRVIGNPVPTQQPGKSKNEELCNSRSRDTDMLDGYEEGQIELSWYVRVANAGSVPEHDVLYQAALGAKSVSGSLVTYSLAMDLDTLSMLLKLSTGVVYAMSGCVVDGLKCSPATKKGAVQMTATIKFMRMRWAGRVDYAAGMTYTSGTRTIVLPTSPGDDHRRFSPGMRVKLWDESESAYLEDAGSNAFFEVESVDADANSIVIAAATSGAWVPATGDKIEPYYPTAVLPTTRVVQAKTGKVYLGTAGASADFLNTVSCDFELQNAVQMLNDEITESGYPERFIADARTITAKASTYFGAASVKHFGRGRDEAVAALYMEARDPNAATDRTNSMQIGLPKTLCNIPGFTGDLARQIDIEYTAAWDESYEDEMELKFGNLAA